MLYYYVIVVSNLQDIPVWHAGRARGLKQFAAMICEFWQATSPWSSKFKCGKNQKVQKENWKQFKNLKWKTYSKAIWSACAVCWHRIRWLVMAAGGNFRWAASQTDPANLASDSYLFKISSVIAAAPLFRGNAPPRSDSRLAWCSRTSLVVVSTVSSRKSQRDSISKGKRSKNIKDGGTGRSH